MRLNAVASAELQHRLPSVNTARTFSKFVVVGGAATALHYAIAILITHLGWAPVVVASTIGFLVSAVFNFVFNARFTFGAKGMDGRQGVRFACTVAAGCAINGALLFAGVWSGMPAALAQLLATAAVLAWNFTLSSRWVFKPRH